MLRLRRAWLALLLGCACGRSSKPSPAADQGLSGRQSTAEASAASNQGSAGTAPPAAPASAQPPIASAPRVGQVTTIEAARRLLNLWNAALNAHDTALLEQLYAPQVAFYGRSFTRSQVIAAKRTAFQASPNFAQVLSELRIAPEANDAASVTFAKTSGSAKGVRARLRVAPSAGGVFAIVTESDEPSDALSHGKESCEAAMYGVALALPEVVQASAHATDDAPFGGLSYPTEGTHYSLSLGYNHEDRFESIFFVDWLNGAFTVGQGGSDNLAIPTAGLARVKAACPK